MSLRNIEFIGRSVKFSFLLLAIYSYHDTDFVPLILVFVAYLGMDEMILSKKLKNIEDKLNRKE